MRVVDAFLQVRDTDRRLPGRWRMAKIRKGTRLFMAPSLLERHEKPSAADIGTAYTERELPSSAEEGGRDIKKKTAQHL
jgi:hypothetical protein